MTSREIVQACLEYRNTGRIPCSFPDPYPHDFGRAGCSLTRTPYRGWEKIAENRWEMTDQWGNTWGRVDPTSKGEVTRGALSDLSKVGEIELPDYDNPDNYKSVKEKVEANRTGEQKYMIGGIPGCVFNIARKMRKLDQYLMDLVLDREKIDILHERIAALMEAAIRNYGTTGIDAIMFAEDWGTQQGLMISPDMWREVFKPFFVRLCRTAHEHNLKMMMHSCGRNIDIIPDLIEAGIDVLQFDQPKLYGIDTLAAFHGQVTFWCPVDIQKTLQTRDSDRIEADAREMVEKMGSGGGGLIAGYYSDNASIGLDPKWQDIACKTFLRFGNPDTTG